ncbi:Transcription termination/antitermination protein NusG [Trichinella spiralis]|uniref:Transcription termination/antitermination protein NusG n=1 Tax=Trichinella spiralis TaxID=6334 RepID=A0ABR3L0G6_TRISP
MRRLLDEVDVLWSHVAEADAVGDYVVTLEKISKLLVILNSCVEELRKRLQADENKMDVDFIAGGKVPHAQRLT